MSTDVKDCDDHVILSSDPKAVDEANEAMTFGLSTVSSKTPSTGMQDNLQGLIETKNSSRGRVLKRIREPMNAITEAEDEASGDDISIDRPVSKLRIRHTKIKKKIPSMRKPRAKKLSRRGKVVGWSKL